MANWMLPMALALCPLLVGCALQGTVHVRAGMSPQALARLRAAACTNQAGMAVGLVGLRALLADVIASLLFLSSMQAPPSC